MQSTSDLGDASIFVVDLKRIKTHVSLRSRRGFRFQNSKKMATQSEKCVLLQRPIFNIWRPPAVQFGCPQFKGERTARFE